MNITEDGKNNSVENYKLYRKKIYASINGTKGGLVRLSKSSFLNKDEKDALKEIINGFNKLIQIYQNNYKKHKKDE